MQCKYGIILSQSYHFVCQCSVIHDFFYSVAKLIHYVVSAKSYVYEDCFEVYRGFCKKRLGIYGKFKLQQLVRPVESSWSGLWSWQCSECWGNDFDNGV